MILSTTPTLEGKPILEYRGIVTGESILGASQFRDFLAGIRDLVGGRFGAYERILGDARQSALDALSAKALEVGANAVVAIDIGYEILGQTNGMLMVSASGTAVRIG